MTWPRLHQLTAAFVFLFALVLYALTVAPTASFWDCGEFIAISYGLQVSHPPGAPFYMLIGRIFSLFASPEGAALAVNYVSVVSSAFTILLTHLIIVRLVRQWQGLLAEAAPWQHVAALAGGVVGALTFAATDSFWFNAVEAEVYAVSMLFTALVVWLILRWSEVAAREEAALPGGRTHPFGLAANRYLVLIAYMFGLAIGIHLLNLLALFFCALIFFYNEYDREDWTTGQRVKALLVLGVASAGVFFLIYPGVIQGIPTLADATGSLFLTSLVIVGGTAAAVWWTHTRRKLALNLLALSIMAVLIGYSTYALIFVRSAADPPIDENDPENVEGIVSYLKREQYGQTPLLSGYSFDDATGQIPTEQTPGARTKLFPRRWSPEHASFYGQYTSDADFFLKYQMGHMYWRYFLWQFVGKDSDVQDGPAITGLSFIDGSVPNRLTYRQTPSERKSRNVYFALPLVLGLFGMAYHFLRDARRAFAVLVLFLLTGLGIIVYLNQYPFQPRERDYSYVASFFAFALWIGIGAAGLAELVAHAVRARGERAMAAAGVAVTALAFVAVPGWMTAENYDDHDRTGQYVAPDYAINMLNSTAPQAVLFTNGDNDTFPLWYAQEVERVRRDVRVANLSLLQTPWYMLQLKNQASRTSPPLPFTLTDDGLRALDPVQWEPQDVTLPVPTGASGEAALPVSARGPLVAAGVVQPEDAAKVVSPLRWRLTGRQLGENFYALYPNDRAVIDIVQANARQGWTRPVYFAVTVGLDGRADLDNYLQLEGQALRVVPIPAGVTPETNDGFGRTQPRLAYENLRRFRFRGLADSTIYFDENIRRMVDNYRNVYARVAQDLVAAGMTREARTLLDTLMVQVPFSTIPGDARSFTFMARAFLLVGADEQAAAIARRAEPLALAQLRGADTASLDAALRLFQIVRLTYLAAGDYPAAVALSEKVAAQTGEAGFRTTLDSARAEARLAREQLGLAPPDTARVGGRSDTSAAP